MEQVHGLTLNQAVEKMRGPATEGLAWYKRSMLGPPFSRVYNPPIIELLRINHTSSNEFTRTIAVPHRDCVVPIQFASNPAISRRNRTPSSALIKRVSGGRSPASRVHKKG